MWTCFSPSLMLSFTVTIVFPLALVSLTQFSSPCLPRPRHPHPHHPHAVFLTLHILVLSLSLFHPFLFILSSSPSPYSHQLTPFSLLPHMSFSNPHPASSSSISPSPSHTVSPTLPVWKENPEGSWKDIVCMISGKYLEGV